MFTEDKVLFIKDCYGATTQVTAGSPHSIEQYTSVIVVGGKNC